MTQTCRECRRINPREAVYCWYDGVVLGRQAGDGASINVGARAFAAPFVFPSGAVCANFEQLARACHADPDTAGELLRQGYLEQFLSGQGRGDLAAAARAAARAADAERGLDDFLGKLPGDALDPPQLAVEPQEIDLGTVPPGQDRRFEIVLRNEGQRLLYGTATAVRPWLSLGEQTGGPQRLFQLRDRFVLPVQVRGAALRANQKPQEGEIELESNGGNYLVTVRLTVPVRPFADGVLAGALSPRQLAEKVREHPAEGAALLESGAVARWYAANGWDYPIQGPTAAGTAAVQQFFEALGLVRAPAVELSTAAFTLSGRPGQQIEEVLAVTTQEKRAVVAFAASDQSWLEVDRTVFRGRVATILLRVASVPARPGHTLTATLHVTANGKQRFDVPVTLKVAGSAVVSSPQKDGNSAPDFAPERRGVEVGAEAPAPVATLVTDPVPPGQAAPEAIPLGPRRRKPRWAHLTPVGLVLAGLLVALVHDLFFRGREDPLGEVRLLDSEPRLILQPQPGTLTFGLLLPDADRSGKRKRLTYSERGLSNNVCVRIDGEERLLAAEAGQREAGGDADEARRGYRATWTTPDRKLAVVEEVGLLADLQSRLLDTCLVRFRLENRDDKAPHKVGLRFLLDTYVGGTDGVPFALPGSGEWCDTHKEMQGAEIPDFIEALERDDLQNPGAVARLGLRLGKKIEPPTLVLIGAWPDRKLAATAGEPRAQAQLTGWEVPPVSMQALNPPDSAVTLYWEEKELAPKATREVGFAYGLGRLFGDEDGGRLALSAGGSFAPGGEFTVLAHVKEPSRGEKVTLTLPDGLTLAGGEATREVSAAATKQRLGLAGWRVRSSVGGRYVLQVKSTDGAAQKLTVTLKARRLFD